MEGGLENLIDEGRFARAGDAGDDGEGVEGDVDIVLFPLKVRGRRMSARFSYQR